ncbi:hypothetical protein OB905_00765 [Halobacteria archaeon AArc-dxtr1]|nr:hypothetical protein [Halobacteria archaeon AArc-dxtr1]
MTASMILFFDASAATGTVLGVDVLVWIVAATTTVAVARTTVCFGGHSVSDWPTESASGIYSMKLATSSEPQAVQASSVLESVHPHCRHS